MSSTPPQKNQGSIKEAIYIAGARQITYLVDLPRPWDVAEMFKSHEESSQHIPLPEWREVAEDRESNYKIFDGGYLAGLEPVSISGVQRLDGRLTKKLHYFLRITSQRTTAPLHFVVTSGLHVGAGAFLIAKIRRQHRLIAALTPSYTDTSKFLVSAHAPNAACAFEFSTPGAAVRGMTGFSRRVLALEALWKPVNR